MHDQWKTKALTFTLVAGLVGFGSAPVSLLGSAHAGLVPAVVLNEIHADPDASAGDANGDGVVQSTADEFVEIVNAGPAAVDVSGWTITDAISTRHEFAPGTILPAGCGVVVFGGGSPTGGFGAMLVQVASSGSLGLNNGGDTVTVSDGGGVVVKGHRRARVGRRPGGRRFDALPPTLGRQNGLEAAMEHAEMPLPAIHRRPKFGIAGQPLLHGGACRAAQGAQHVGGGEHRAAWGGPGAHVSRHSRRRCRPRRTQLFTVPSGLPMCSASSGWV